MRRPASLVHAAALAAGLMTAAAVHAQACPARSVRMIIPFGPGGSSDSVGRTVQPKMTELPGQPASARRRNRDDG